MDDHTWAIAYIYNHPWVDGILLIYNKKTLGAYVLPKTWSMLPNPDVKVWL